MKLLFAQCSCTATGFQRIPRSLWMRAFPSKRLYYCQTCNSKIFTEKDLIIQMAWEDTTIKMFNGQVVSNGKNGGPDKDNTQARY